MRRRATTITTLRPPIRLGGDWAHRSPRLQVAVPRTPGRRPRHHRVRRERPGRTHRFIGVVGERRPAAADLLGIRDLIRDTCDRRGRHARRAPPRRRRHQRRAPRSDDGRRPARRRRRVDTARDRRAQRSRSAGMGALRDREPDGSGSSTVIAAHVLQISIDRPVAPGDPATRWFTTTATGTARRTFAAGLTARQIPRRDTRVMDTSR